MSKLIHGKNTGRSERSTLNEEQWMDQRLLNLEKTAHKTHDPV